MRRLLAAAVAASFALGGVAAAPASDSSGQDQKTGTPAPRESFELAPGDSESVTGAAPSGFYAGLAAVRDAVGEYPDCSDDVPGVFYCESFLVSISGGEVVVDEDTGAETLVAELLMELTPDTPAGDFDIRVFESDEEGTPLSEEPTTATQELLTDQPNERLKLKVRTSAEEPVRHYLIVIDYWLAVGNYSMDLTVS